MYDEVDDLDQENEDDGEATLVKLPLNPESKRCRIDPWQFTADHVYSLGVTPWVRVPRLSSPAVCASIARHVELIWCNFSERCGEVMQHLDLSASQLRAARAVYARFEVSFIPATSSEGIPPGFVFQTGNRGQGWYRDPFTDRVLRQGLVVPSRDGLQLSAPLPVARPLHQEQASCVAWLLAQDQEFLFVESNHTASLPCLELAVRCYTAAPAHTAVLCHAVGFGKTACALAFIVANAANLRNLVICPPHILHQWEQEAKLVIPTFSVARLDLTSTTLPSADILLATPTFFKQKPASSTVNRFLHSTTWRLVIDEAHELTTEQAEPALQNIIKLRSCQRLLLTATPPLEDLVSLRRLARLAGVCRMPADAGELQHFLSFCACTSDWTACHIPIESKTIPCHLSGRERVLYRSMCQHIWSGTDSLQSDKALLLQACTQFSPDASESVESAVRNKLKKLEEELKAAEDDMRTLRMQQVGGDEAANAAQTAKRAAASLRYFQAAMHAASGEATEEECSICYERLDTQSASITICGHTFHSACIEAAWRYGNALCPMCRTELKQGDVEKALRFQQPPLVETEHHGTKIAQILEALCKIRAAEGVGEKVVIMAQWPEVLGRLENALKENGMIALTLSGGSESVQLSLRTFIEDTTPAASVLLLSTSEHCSGLNLTCARHLFIVHPFLADNEPQAIAIEQQAIGRLWRRGQHRTVSVVRFVAQETVEEEISTQHFHAVQTLLTQ